MVTNANRPLLAVTMGDAAGIGPEIVVRALAHRDTYRQCRPLVVGDVDRLRVAADVRGAGVEVVRVAAPEAGVYEHGRVDVLQPGESLGDLPWGQLSPAAGAGAVAFVKAACALGRDGAIDGIVTAPLNKEAMHAAGHRYPGHTELLAEEFGVDRFGLVLSAGDVFVFHVTTHVALREAIARVTPERVASTVRLAAHFAKATGRGDEPIVMLGLNPHAGEHGLFGDEEERAIVPGLEQARASGVTVDGPAPADAAIPRVFKRGSGFLVACYHDQGHAPFKAAFGDAGVNITVGLPILRVSVDHGTAFDIAGQGIARDDSLREAIRRAVELTPVWGDIDGVMQGDAE